MITITVPDNASLEDVKKAFTLEVLRLDPCQTKAAEQIGVDRTTLARWLEEWGIIIAYVQDSPEAIPARQRKKPRAARAAPPSAPPSKPRGKSTGFQATLDEARVLRANYERRRASGGTA